MKTINNQTFEEIYKQNERRIHFYIHKLKINDPQQEFFQEGLCAMWNAYETYQPDKGTMATYFNYTIRNRLIDHLRKATKENEAEKKLFDEVVSHADTGNRVGRNEKPLPLVSLTDCLEEDTDLWRNLKSQLTENQWKWVYFYIIGEQSLKDIAIQENTTAEAVKSWGKQVRSKLRKEEFRKKVGWEF
ncbi:sigma-70 family RNA polymerase sigma factor [Virgibacillus sp. C22-A2]|uniref:Sigma-70 family RNA polymerase sigma factor n=1 Tax=Virgibacillus tibetensis TaxID=3042313 RepID=A0ABU6KIV6_9BACI|nr:sigma-70 family RNA polymerase sigma factor [Virgibacillus sp. C22-A2]